MPTAIARGLDLNGAGKNKIDKKNKIIGATASHPFFTSKLNSGPLKISCLAVVLYPITFKAALDMLVYTLSNGCIALSVYSCLEM